MASLVEIFIPVFNGAEYLADAISSALCQTHRDIRVVVVDNASTDGSVEVAESFLADPRLRIVRQSENVGMTNNFNACVRERQESYFTLLCADNVLKPHYVERMLEIFDAFPEAQVVTGRTEMLDMKTGRVSHHEAHDDMAPRIIPPMKGIVEPHISFNAFMVHPSLAFSFDPAFTYAPDERLWREWAVCGVNVVYLPEVLAVYRVHGTNMGTVTPFAKRLHEQLAAVDWVEQVAQGPMLADVCSAARLQVCAYMHSVTTDGHERAILERLLRLYLPGKAADRSGSGATNDATVGGP